MSFSYNVVTKASVIYFAFIAIFDLINQFIFSSFVFYVFMTYDVIR